MVILIDILWFGPIYIVSITTYFERRGDTCSTSAGTPEDAASISAGTPGSEAVDYSIASATFEDAAASTSACIPENAPSTVSGTSADAAASTSSGTPFYVASTPADAASTSADIPTDLS